MTTPRLHIFFALYMVFSCVFVAAQSNDCGCTNCPQFMPDNFQGDFLVNVIGATNDDLSDPNQGICEIRLEFDHQYIGDLAILLTSPSGQEIELVGPIGMFGDTDLSTWDISFVPCAENPMPDLGFGIWQNEELTAQNFEFTGSYHPFGGCLEDFNTGPTNGTWTLTVIDDQAIDFGTFIDYEIIFCDEDGINCNSNPCGVFANAEAPSFACDGDVVEIDASSSVGNFFQWGTVDGSFVGTPSGPFAQVSESGTYSVTVSDNGDCPEVATVIFNTVPELPTIDITASNPLDCNNTEATLVGVTSVSDNLFVNWIIGEIIDPNNILPISTELDLTIFEPGTYTMIVVDTESACSQSASITIADEAIPPTIETQADGDLSCGVDEIDISATSNFNNSSFAWSGPNGFSSTSPTNTITTSGIYNVTVTAPNGCIDSSQVIVLSDTQAPTVGIAVSNVLNCTNTTAELAIITSDEINAFIWSGPNNYRNDTERNPTVDQAGTYNLIATTANGCETDLDITLLENTEQPVIQIGNNYQITCTDNTVSIDGSGSSQGAPFSYAWFDENDLIISSELAIDIYSEGTFSLEITNSENGCSNLKSISILDQRDLPEVEIPIPDTITCYKPTVQLHAHDPNNKNLEYIWSDAQSNIINTNPNANSIHVDQEGIYDVTIIDPTNGCEFIYSINVEADLEVPDINIDANNNSIIDCDNPSLFLASNLINLDVNEVSINWTTVGGNFVSGQNTLNPEVNAAGVYQLEVTNLSNGCIDVAKIIIMQDENIPLASLNNPGNLTCTTESVILSTTADGNNLEIVWSLDGEVLQDANTNELVVDRPGEYMVITTNTENGCTSLDEIIISQNIEAPIVDAGEGFELQCNIPVFELTASVSSSDDFIIEWDVVNGNIVQGESTLNPIVDQAGTYTLQALNTSNGCTASDVIKITVNENIPVDLVADIQDPICEGDLGSISNLEVLGGVAPFMYSIDGGATYAKELNYDQLTSGTYQLEALDANACPISNTVTIEEAADIAVSLNKEIKIILGDNAVLQTNLINIDPSNIQSIQWTPSTGLSCDDCLSPTSTATNDILYIVEIIVDGGCSVMDAVQLRVDRELNVYVPNAFSPFTIDGFNDVFYLFAKEGVVNNIKRFAVFDRWGNEVFLQQNIQPNDSSLGWDGKLRNENMPVGVYIYFIEIEYNNGSTQVLKGDLLLSK